MAAGKRSDDGMAFEEIANGAFKTCMSQLAKQCNYDVVLLDSSPILLGADATILASQVDGTIMVEREHVSRRTNVVNALSRLNCAGGRLLGTVFIGSGAGDDYGYAYGYDRYRKRVTRGS
jgi:Mrp family chromosome partitioning ATPase